MRKVLKAAATAALVLAAACGREPTAARDAGGAVPRHDVDPLSAQIWGPNPVRPNDGSCFWEGLVSGGTPPYTRTWQGGSAGGGSGQFYYTSFSTFIGPSNFIRLVVTDAAGQQVTVTTAISVSNQATPCG